LRSKFERYGVDDLCDRRRRTPSPKRPRRKHQVGFCDAFVKKALQAAVAING